MLSLLSPFRFWVKAHDTKLLARSEAPPTAPGSRLRGPPWVSCFHYVMNRSVKPLFPVAIAFYSAPCGLIRVTYCPKDFVEGVVS